MKTSNAWARSFLATLMVASIGCSGTGDGTGGTSGEGGSGGAGAASCDESMGGDATCASLDPSMPRCVDGRCVECLEAGDCEGDTPVCLDNACASCGETGVSAACAAVDASVPVCTASGACVACTDHEQCDSEVCDRDASVCVPEEQIVYVANGGFLGDQESGADTPGCGIPQSKCQSITFAVENRLDDELGRTWVRIADGFYDGFLGFQNQTARLIGGTQVRFNESVQGDVAMSLIEVGEGVDLLIDRLLIETAGASSRGIRCRAEERIPSTVALRRSTVAGAGLAGLQLDDFCSGEVTASTLERNGRQGILVRGRVGPLGNEALIVHESIIRDNTEEGISCQDAFLTIERSLIERNGQGGISLRDSSFVVRNNFIQDNGRSSNPFPSSVGGVRFRDDGPEPRTFEFNTVVANGISEFTTSSPGVSCEAGAPIEISNSIIWDNSGNRADFAETNPQVSSSCVVAYSNVQGGLNPNNHSEVGPGNIDTDPLFVDAARGDFRIEPDSLAKDAADPEATLGIDFDGTPRPQGAAADMGAHEVAP